LEGADYYRLRIAEQDGKTSYSAIQLLNFGNGIKIAIYPNPVKNSVTVTGLATGMTVNVTNALGQPMLWQKATGNTAVLNISNMPAGLYELRVIGTDGQPVISGTKLVKE
jgi:hypothetical protein